MRSFVATMVRAEERPQRVTDPKLGWGREFDSCA
jgi:hypothetical protein